MVVTEDRIYIDVNPRGESPHFLGLIVDHRSGVIYGNQAGGLACVWRSLEGYLAVLGSGAVAESYVRFFTRFDGRPPLAGEEWSPEDLAELSALVAGISGYSTTDESGYGETELAVRVDSDRVDELTEGWIPVRVGEAQGVLVFPNSD
jgi:hypothetical protein